MGDIGAAKDDWRSIDADEEMRKQVSALVDSDPEVEATKGKTNEKMPCSSSENGHERQQADTTFEDECWPKFLPFDRRKPRPAEQATAGSEQPTNTPQAPSRASLAPSACATPSSNTPSFTIRCPSFPPDYESDGPHGGFAAAQWRRRFVSKFESFTASMSNSERVARFDDLVAKDGEHFVPVFATYFYNHPDHIPSREVSDARKKQEVAMWTAMTTELEQQQMRVFGAAWFDPDRSPFATPEIPSEAPAGPKDEAIPGQIAAEHVCAYCKAVAAKRKWRNRGAAIAASRPIRLVRNFVNVRKRKQGSGQADNVTTTSPAKAPKVVAAASTTTNTSGISSTEPDPSKPASSDSRLFRLLRRETGGSRQSNKVQQRRTMVAVGA